LGSVVKTALWMPCLALGLDLRISGITLLTVSFALLARSERLFVWGATTTVGCSRPMIAFRREGSLAKYLTDGWMCSRNGWNEGHNESSSQIKEGNWEERRKTNRKIRQ
jgi:hypothetical protein